MPNEADNCRIFVAPKPKPPGRDDAHYSHPSKIIGKFSDADQLRTAGNQLQSLLLRRKSSTNVIESGHHYRKQSKLRLGPSGIHLFNRVSGLNLLIDEIVPPEAEWAVAPRQVSIALTNSCDLRCPYCFAPKTASILDFDRLISWLIELDTSGTFGIGFGGGEPTLYPRLAELCAWTAKNTDLAVTFTTHGHRLESPLLDSLKGNVHFVRVSMDGVGETYERLRNRSFKALQKRLDSLRNIVPFGINFVVNRDTLPDIDKAATLAKEVGATEFLILQEHPANGRDGIDGETTKSLREWVSHYSGGLRLAVSETDAGGMPTCNPLPLETGLRAYAHIDANGVLKRTSFDRDGIVIGSNGVMIALSELHQKTTTHI